MSDLDFLVIATLPSLYGGWLVLLVVALLGVGLAMRPIPSQAPGEAADA